MKKHILGGLAVAAMLAGGLAISSAGIVSADQPDHAVQHTGETCNGTFIKSQPPGSGFTVTATYSGNMWIKISTQHVFVPAVTVGDTFGPGDLSGWPTNQNDQYQEVSHVDYCVTTSTPTPVTPTQPTSTPPTCDAPGSVNLPGDTVGYDWVKQDDGSYQAVAQDEYVFAAGAVTTFPAPARQLTGTKCDCAANAFFDKETGEITMWEITWGRQNTDTDGAPTFTRDSYGGLTDVNEAGIPTYFTPGWKWLYVTPANVANGRTVTYDFADGTRITATVSATADGCPKVAWVTGRIPAQKPIVEYGEITNDKITCDSTEFITRQEVSTTPFVWDAEAGKNVEGKTVVTVKVSERPLSSDELAAQKAKCSTDTTQPPTDAIAPPIGDVVAQLPPVLAPTTAVSAAGPTAPAVGSLPATGSNETGIMALIALLATALGGFALFVSRRSNLTS